MSGRIVASYFKNVCTAQSPFILDTNDSESDESQREVLWAGVNSRLNVERR